MFIDNQWLTLCADGKIIHNQTGKLFGFIFKNMLYDNDYAPVGHYAGNQVFDRGGFLVATWNPPMLTFVNGISGKRNLSRDMRSVAAYLLLVDKYELYRLL